MKKVIIASNLRNIQIYCKAQALLIPFRIDDYIKVRFSGSRYCCVVFVPGTLE